jgi:WD40 repeat protein
VLAGQFSRLSPCCRISGRIALPQEHCPADCVEHPRHTDQRYVTVEQGHQAEVLDVQFSPDGDSLATASADKTILLWRVYGDCQKYVVSSLFSQDSARC